jgi:hypothetical protein
MCRLQQSDSPRTGGTTGYYFFFGWSLKTHLTGKKIKIVFGFFPHNTSPLRHRATSPKRARFRGFSVKKRRHSHRANACVREDSKDVELSKPIKRQNKKRFVYFHLNFSNFGGGVVCVCAFYTPV